MPTHVPPLSVVTSVFNNAPYLPLAIESILNQSLGDFEFLIVNDGSTDGSAEIMDGYAARDSRIKILHQENRGTIVAVNRGIAEARSPLIARMDGDDIAKPDRFEKQMAFISAHPDTCLLGTAINLMDEDGADTGRKVVYPQSDSELRHNLDEDQGPNFAQNTVIMRKTVFDALGGYHAAYRHCEDYDLWLRFSSEPGTKMANLAEPLVYYRKYAGQVSSRHMVAQAIGASVSYAAHRERLAGRSDPTKALSALPGLDAIDDLFGRFGIAASVRSRALTYFLYSADSLSGDGYRLVLDHIRDGSVINKPQLWRAAVRLAKAGHFAQAVGVAKALALG